MQEGDLRQRSVPWTTQDVWLGMAACAAWLAAAIGFAVLLILLSWQIDLGLFVTLWELPLVVPAWWFTVRKYKVGWRTLGIQGFSAQTLGIGLGLMTLSMAFNLVYNLALSPFGLQAQMDFAVLFQELSSPWLLLVGGIVVAPVVEELFFRGFVFSGLRERYGWSKAGLISAGLFALIHLQPLAVIPIFILGMIFAYLYHRSGSIWPAVIMHVLTNGLGLGAAYLASQMDIPLG
jgi:membrane protease YdiL (CAAX protease family)